jgi:hypothetical protein
MARRDHAERLSRTGSAGNLWQASGMPTRWEYGSLITIALAASQGQPPEHLAGVLVTALQSRVVSVVELADLVPGERYTAMNAVGQEGWIVTGPPSRTEFNRGAAVPLASIGLDPWIGVTLASSPVGSWARGYQEYPLRRPLD